MQFTLFCRNFDLVAKYAFSQAPSCTNFSQPGSASDSRTGLGTLASPQILSWSICRLHSFTFCQSLLLYIVLFLKSILLRINFLLKISPGPLPLLSVDHSCLFSAGLFLLPLSSCQPLGEVLSFSSSAAFLKSSL